MRVRNCLRFAHPAEADLTLEARKIENLHFGVAMEWKGNGMEWNGMIWNGMESFVQNRCKIHQQRSPRPSKLLLEAPKIEVGDAPESQDARKKRPRPAKRCPRAPKRQPRRAQERPRDAQETPQRGRETVNLLKNRCSEGLERIPDVFGSIRGARCGPILEKSILRSLCDRISIGFFDDRKKRDP